MHQPPATAYLPPLAAWVEQCQLPAQCFELLWVNGFDNVELLAQLTDAEMSELYSLAAASLPLGTRKKLMNAINSLRVNNVY